MALTTNTDIDFDSSAGYTFPAEIEFVNVGGADVCRLKNSAGAVSKTVETPLVDMSAWSNNAHQLTMTFLEPVGYSHKFLVSFDGGTVWKTYDLEGWSAVDEADISTFGVPLNVLLDVREWPDIVATAEDIKFLIEITRETGGGDGNIDQINILFGTTELDLTQSPGVIDSLPTAASGRSLEPDRPASKRSRWAKNSTKSFSGHIVDMPIADQVRDEWPNLRWRGLTDADADTLFSFLWDHIDAPFKWTPPSDVEKNFIVRGTPIREQLGPSGTTLIVATWEQWYSGEQSSRTDIPPLSGFTLPLAG